MRNRHSISSPHLWSKGDLHRVGKLVDAGKYGCTGVDPKLNILGHATDDIKHSLQRTVSIHVAYRKSGRRIALHYAGSGEQCRREHALSSASRFRIAADRADYCTTMYLDAFATSST